MCPERAAARFEALYKVRVDVFPAKAGIVLVALAAIGNLAYRNKQTKGNQENYGRKKITIPP